MQFWATTLLQASSQGLREVWEELLPALVGGEFSWVCHSWTLSPCSSQREDEIEAIISISDGLNLVSAHLSQLPGPEHSSLLPPGIEGAGEGGDSLTGKL